MIKSAEVDASSDLIERSLLESSVAEAPRPSSLHIIDTLSSSNEGSSAGCGVPGPGLLDILGRAI